MKKQFFGSLLAAGLACSLVPTGTTAAGNPELGKKKFYTCVGCHGVAGYTNSYPTYHVPRLGGQHPAYLESALKAYASGERNHPSMQGNSASLSEKDMGDIIAYLSKYRGLNEHLIVTGDVAEGKKKAAACGSCHGEDGNSTDPNFPRLAAQYEDYLAQSLLDYKKGNRKNPIMAGFAASLSEQDRKDIGAYYASQKKGLTTPED